MTRFATGAMLLIVLSCSPSAHGRQRRGRAAEIQTVQLPSDYAVDLQLATLGRSRMMRGSSALVGTPLNEIGQEVFDTLVGNSTISAFGLPYQWNLTLVNNTVTNAASDAGGQVYVYGGLAHLIGSNRGLWAAVLSHELSHTALRHHVRLYLMRLYIAQQIQYYRWLAAHGDKSANWALLGFEIAAPITLKKMEREQEHQADIQGMKLMARAGYHPDFVFVLHHLLQMKGGEQSKFAAFFSDHPRWATRDQRSEGAYADALAEYNHLWPDAGGSPGRTPPLVAFLEAPRASEDKGNKAANISVPLYCRNAGEPVTLLLQFRHDNHAVPGAQPQFADPGGNLQVSERILCPDKEDAKPVEIRLPANVVPRRSRKLKAQLTVMDPLGVPIEKSRVFDVRVPKP